MANRKKQTAPAKREPHDSERVAMDIAEARRRERPVRAAYVEEPGPDGQLHVTSPHSDADRHAKLVTETFGTRSDHVVGEGLLRLANITSQGGKPSMQGLNASLAIVAAIEPRDEFEGALATQLAATHALAMDLMCRASNAPTREAMKDYGNLATKFSRTFTTQMKALSDWRRGGVQEVLHRHVNVYEGGQAVVADTVMIGGQNENGAIKPHEQGALSPAMLGNDAQGYGLPVSGDQGAESVSASRRTNKRRGSA